MGDLITRKPTAIMIELLRKGAADPKGIMTLSDHNDRTQDGILRRDMAEVVAEPGATHSWLVINERGMDYLAKLDAPAAPEAQQAPEAAPAAPAAPVLPAGVDPTRIHFEMEPCGRCGGSGEHLFNQRDGRVCWGCSGNGEHLSARGRRAAEAYDAALERSAGTVRVADIKPGMIIKCRAHGGVVNGNQPWDYKAAWRTVAEVKVEQYTFRATGVRDGNRVDVEGWRAELAFEGGKTWSAESSDDPAYWAKGAGHTIYTERSFWLRSEEAREARTAVRVEIARRFTGAWLEGEEPPARQERKPRPEAADKPAPAPRPLAANAFPGDCHKCGGRVEAQRGERLKLDGRWAVQHKEGECQERPAAQEAQEGAQALAGVDTRGMVDTSDGDRRAFRYEGTQVRVWAADVDGVTRWHVDGADGAEVLDTPFPQDAFNEAAAQLPQEAATAAEEAPVRPAMTNRYAGRCHGCGARVAAEGGERVRLDGGWVTRHRAGECQAGG